MDLSSLSELNFFFVDAPLIARLVGLVHALNEVVVERLRGGQSNPSVVQFFFGDC